MSAVLAIATNTFREAIRDRILYLILFFALLVIVGSELIAILAVGATEKVVIDLGLSAIALFGVLISVFLGLSLVAKEIERRTVFSVLTKPVSRAAFILGKLAGLYLTLLLLVTAMTAVFFAFLHLRFAVSRPGLLLPVGLSLMEDLVIAAFALLFSSFTTPILGTLFTLTVYAVGHLSFGLRMLAAFPEVARTPWEKVLLGLYWVLPDLERFNVRGAAVHGLPIDAGYAAGAVFYGLSYAGAVLALAIAVFGRRDFV